MSSWAEREEGFLTHVSFVGSPWTWPRSRHCPRCGVLL
uniref:Uncharacterized protein n=1 Tax=Anguilla anguilla TaxID=7936 RepID=A0A0E9UUQ9_ANGAN